MHLYTYIYIYVKKIHINRYTDKAKYMLITRNWYLAHADNTPWI